MFGVIGLGQMGGAIARRLVAENKDPQVFDISAEAMVATGAKRCAQSPAEMVAECDIILVVVLDDAQVRHVVTGEDGILAGFAQARKSHQSRRSLEPRSSDPQSSDSRSLEPQPRRSSDPRSSDPQSRQPLEPSPHWPPVVLVHSTIHPETASELAEQCAEAGLDMLDAPVTGGARAVENGDLVVMLGGPQQVCDQVVPELSDYVGLAVRVGDWGAGQRAKIARNLITYSEWVVAAEATALAAASSVDIEQFWKVIDHSDLHIGSHGGFGGIRSLLPAPDAMRPLAGLARKDLELASALARQMDCDPWLPDRAASLMSAVLLGE